MIDKKFWKKSLSHAWAFAFLLIISVFYLNLSLVLVSFLKGNYFTGLYSSAFKFIQAMILIPQSLALALFPLSSRLLLTDKKKLMNVYKKGLVVLFASSLPFAFVLVVFADKIINLAYGQDYLQAVSALGILGAGLILFFINALPGNIIQNSDKFKKFLPWSVFNFLIKLVLCLILIPRFSIIGAAWAVVGGEVAGVLINNLFVWKILKN